MTISENTRLAEYYAENFPHDSAGLATLDKHATFRDLFEALDSYEDIYDKFNIEDSIVRERLFDGLAIVSGMPYDEIYTQWMACG